VFVLADIIDDGRVVFEQGMGCRAILYHIECYTVYMYAIQLASILQNSLLAP